MHKDIFIDSHEQPDVIEDRNCFLTKIEELKLYIFKFNKNGAIKVKNYLVNCTVEKEKRCLIIIITHDKCTFFANDRIQKAWTQEGDIFL